MPLPFRLRRLARRPSRTRRAHRRYRQRRIFVAPRLLPLLRPLRLLFAAPHLLLLRRRPRRLSEAVRLPLPRRRLRLPRRPDPRRTALPVVHLHPRRRLHQVWAAWSSRLRTCSPQPWRSVPVENNNRLKTMTGRR